MRKVQRRKFKARTRFHDITSLELEAINIKLIPYFILLAFFRSYLTQPIEVSVRQSLPTSNTRIKVEVHSSWAPRKYNGNTFLHRLRCDLAIALRPRLDDASGDLR